MSPHNNGSEPLLSEAEVMRIIEEMGGPAALLEGAEEFHQAVVRMDEEREQLTAKHPYKWVVMSNNGVLAIGDTLEQVLEEIEDGGNRPRNVFVDFMDPDPMDMIL